MTLIEREKKVYKVDSLRTHPDKNIGNPAAQGEFLQVSQRWETVQLAFETLGCPDGFYHSRWKYDSEGDDIRYAFRKAFETVNNGKTFKEYADILRAKEQSEERYKRMRATRKNQDEGNGKFMCCVVFDNSFVLIVSSIT